MCPGASAAQGFVQCSALRRAEVRTHSSDMEDGEAGAEPQGFQLDGAVSDKLSVCPLWMGLAGPSYSHHCYHLTSNGIR